MNQETGQTLTRFAPELRVIGDVGFNLEQLLSAVGLPSASVLPKALHEGMCVPISRIVIDSIGQVKNSKSSNLKDVVHHHNKNNKNNQKKQDQSATTMRSSSAPK